MDPQRRRRRSLATVAQKALQAAGKPRTDQGTCSIDAPANACMPCADEATCGNTDGDGVYCFADSPECPDDPARTARMVASIATPNSKETRVARSCSRGVFEISAVAETVEEVGPHEPTRRRSPGFCRLHRTWRAPSKPNSTRRKRRATSPRPRPGARLTRPFGRRRVTFTATAWTRCPTWRFRRCHPRHRRHPRRRKRTAGGCRRAAVPGRGRLDRQPSRPPSCQQRLRWTLSTHTLGSVPRHRGRPSPYLPISPHISCRRGRPSGSSSRQPLSARTRAHRLTRIPSLYMPGCKQAASRSFLAPPSPGGAAVEGRVAPLTRHRRQGPTSTRRKATPSRAGPPAARHALTQSAWTQAAFSTRSSVQRRRRRSRTTAQCAARCAARSGAVPIRCQT